MPLWRGGPPGTRLPRKTYRHSVAQNMPSYPKAPGEECGGLTHKVGVVDGDEGRHGAAADGRAGLGVVEAQRDAGHVVGGALCEQPRM